MYDDPTLKEIIEFLKTLNIQIDANSFQRLTSDDKLNIYISILISLGVTESLELDEEEKNLFVTYVQKNKGPKIIKVTALINDLFSKFGYSPNFSPLYIYSPNFDKTQQTLMQLIEIKNKIEEYKKNYTTMTQDYEYVLSSRVQFTQKANDLKYTNIELTKALEQGLKLSNELSNDINNYKQKIQEINPKIDDIKEKIAVTNNDVINKNNDFQKNLNQIQENKIILEKLKERVVPDPEEVNKIIEKNENILIQTNEILNNENLIGENILAIDTVCQLVAKKLENLKITVDKYHKLNADNSQTIEQIFDLQNEIAKFESQIIDFVAEYKRITEKLKNADISYKNKLEQIKEKKNLIIKELQKNDDKLKLMNNELNEITKEVILTESQIQKINMERDELSKIRKQYTELFKMKFRDLEKRRIVYYQILDKALGLYSENKIEIEKNEKEEKKP